MKKFLLWFFGIIIGLLLLIYILVFSPIGNAIFKPVVQSQIDKYSPVALKLEKFSLGLFSTDIILKNDPRLVIELNGSYNLFTLNLDLALNVDANDISLFGDMVGVPLSGAFQIDTKIQGKVFDTLAINVISDIAKSNTKIDAELTSLNPSKILASIKNLHIDEILAMIGQKPYITGLLGLQADVSGNENLEFDGKALLQVSEGVFSQSLIQKDFGVAIPKTNFGISLDALFDMDTINHNFVFDSNIGKILSAGASKIKTLSTQSTYNINLSDLSVFTPLIGMKVRGDFKTNGEVKGDMAQLQIQGSSDVANSKTSYQALLKDLAPTKATLTTSNLRVEKILYMLYQPQYVSGSENADIEIWDFDKGISAKVKSSLQGVTSNAVIKKEFDMDMPNTPFSYESNITLDKGVGGGDFNFYSTLADIKLPKISLDINKIHINAPYTASIPNLKKLKFATGIELAGKFDADGTFDMKDTIVADFHTSSLGGNINAKLAGDDFNAKIENLDLMSLLKTAQFPEIFSAKMNGDLTYNLASENGNLKAILSSGKFQKNQLTDALKTYLKFDATGLLFNDIKLNSDIKKLLLTSSLDMQSGDFSLNGKDIITDLEKSTIKAKLKVAIKKDAVDVNLNGNLTSPKVDIDFTNQAKQ